MQATLSFQASGVVNVLAATFDYRYGVYILYNLGFKAKAVILEWKDWALKPRLAYTPKDRSMKIFEKTGSIDLRTVVGTTRRWVTLGDGPQPEDDWFDNSTMSANPALGPGSLIRRATPGSSTGEFPLSPSVRVSHGCNERQLTFDLERCYVRPQLVQVHKPALMPSRSSAGHHPARNALELCGYAETSVRVGLPV